MQNKNKRETEISRRLDHLDNLICNSNNLLNINTTLNEYEALKTELLSIYDRFLRSRQTAILGINENRNKREVYFICETKIKSTFQTGD